MKLRNSRLAVALVSLLALTACDLYPDAGKWNGYLSLQGESFLDRTSCDVSVDITHTEDVVVINSLDSYCGSRSMHWSLGALRRRGDGLWKGDERVGDIQPDGTVSVTLVDPFFTAQYPNRADRVRVSWTRMGEDLHFTLTEEYGREARVTDGEMHRVN